MGIVLNVWVLVISLLVVWLSYNIAERRSAQSDDIAKIKSILEHELPLKKEIADIKGTLQAMKKEIAQLTEDIKDLKKDVTEFSGAVLEQLTKGKEKKGFAENFPVLVSKACSVAEQYVTSKYFKWLCDLTKSIT